MGGKQIRLSLGKFELILYFIKNINHQWKNTGMKCQVEPVELDKILK